MGGGGGRGGNNNIGCNKKSGKRKGVREIASDSSGT